MYRQGLTTTQIAATAGVGQNTVRYHLAIAAAAEPSIRNDHRNAIRTPPVTRITAEGLRNLADTIALYKAEDRLPSKQFPLRPGAGPSHMAPQTPPGPRPGHALPHLQGRPAGNPRLGTANPQRRRRKTLAPTPARTR